jgi:formylglycine-generating enzyme required for sulfatase activity
VPTDGDVAQLLACVADPEAAFTSRLAAAERLAALGDPRLDRPTMVAIPAGVLQHRATREGPTTPVALPTFHIGEHLVTVHAYADFIADGGYDDPAYWSPEGWRWRGDHDIDAPRFWNEHDEWGAYLVPNHPVVGVSFFEAEAYASYRKARLPSEHEWERACRGDDGRDYPWGSDWREGASGQRDFGPRSTLPIGIFPGSVSPFGTHDMVGSVWQWTTAERDPAGDYGQARVACGGAWNNLPWSIGAAGRNAFAPTARFSNLGLRLAR